jgi:acetyl/propionyl-CoA carboxylase alpha subunit
MPVMVKAAAGGGGKGMRVVTEAAALAAAIEGASREAQSAFGDGRVYLERFLPEARHVEIQVFGDTSGHVVHLFERECSIQRRHQKLIEEAPSPALDDALRNRMGEAAVAAASAVGYRGAGTVEFLLDEESRFFFMEMNTRIQVEHPVTELTAGIDLVQLQIRVANGEPLPFVQSDLRQRGHAIECRIYAEDPDRDFLPSIGRLALVRVPSGPGIRLDTGVETGDEVPVDYDPILAKLVVWAEDRPRAIARMIGALEETVVLGVATTRGFARRVLEHPAFVAGRTFTSFVARHREELFAHDPAREMAAAAVAAVSPAAGGRQAMTQTSPVSSLWTRLGRWRLGEAVDGR